MPPIHLGLGWIRQPRDRPHRCRHYHYEFDRDDFGKYSHWGAPDAAEPRSPREASAMLNPNPHPLTLT